MEILMKRIPIFIKIFITVTIISGCSLFGTKQFKRLSSSFPLSPGSTWTYAIYNYSSPNLKQDTMQVKILQTDTTSEQIQSLWILQYHRLVDSTFTLPNGHVVYTPVILRVLHTDSIAISYSRNALRFSFPQNVVATKIAYPLKVGEKWTDNNSRYTIISKDSLSWDKDKSYKSYRIVQKISTYRDKGTITYWIEPDIGIVKINYNEMSGTSPTGPVALYKATLTLLSYKIN